MLASHSAPRHYTPSRLDSLTNYSREDGQRQQVTQHPGTTLHIGRIYLRTTAAETGSFSRSLSTQALNSISVGFTYILQPRRRAVLAGHSAPRHYTPSRLDLLPTAAGKGSVSWSLNSQALQSISVGFTYSLQPRRRAVLAGHSAPRHYTPSRLDSLTNYSSEGGQC